MWHLSCGFAASGAGLPTPPLQAEIQAQWQWEAEQRAEQWRLQKEQEEELARRASTDRRIFYGEMVRCEKCRAQFQLRSRQTSSLGRNPST